MKLILIIYSGSDTELVPGLLDRHQAGGYSELPQVHGAGSTGRRQGTRAWPGDASVYFSIVPARWAEKLMTSLREVADALPGGERIHAAVMPVEDYF